MEILAEELWRAIPGYEGRYEASNQGRIRSIPRSITQTGNGGTLFTRKMQGRVLRLAQGPDYLMVALGKTGKWAPHVHDLVAAAWIGEKPSGLCVNHINGIKTDNRAENLEYVTQSDNLKHAYRIGLKTAEGEANGQAKLTEELVRYIRQRPAHESCYVIARQLGVHRVTVREARCGITWKHIPMQTCNS